MKKKAIHLRCWITINGEKFLGPGPIELLEWIEKEGSIVKAAKQMGMSYKKAWDLIDHLNTQSKHPFVELRQGGQHGGGAGLTSHAKKVITEYKSLTHKLQQLMEKNMGILKMI